MKYTTQFLLVFLTWISGMIQPLWAQDDVLVADFESEDYGQWTVTGEAFGPGPAAGTLPNQMEVSGFQGSRLVNSYFNGDQATGTLTSPEFKIQRHYLAFLIGGGRNQDQLSLRLLLDGKVVRQATGLNDQDGGSEALEPSSWDVQEFQGRMAVLEIRDQATGGWGHISVDHIVQTQTKPPGLISDAEREFEITGRYLHLPIRNGAPKRKVTLLLDGQVLVRNDIELADDKPDWWAPMEVAAWEGQQLTLRVDQLAETSTALSSIQQSDELMQAENLYKEALRGQFHFSPRRGWNNDPNGMVFYNNEYHLFFQHNPYGWGWGNMHWGHAVSDDMVHWKELGDKLLPDQMGPMFSGSAVVDWNNTSGLGSKEKPAMVLIYTAAGDPAVQGIAFSTDGRNFQKYEGNPILPEITGGNRDPKVIWHPETQRWVMVLYVELEGKHTIHFFTSPNLIDWSLASINEGDSPGGRYLFECPDFFELPIDGDPNNTKWVLMAADSAYAVGSFDGKTFVPEQERIAGTQGRGFYAAQTFSDIPDSDGRRIQIGWWQTPTPGMSFNQSMTMPLELKLTQTDAGPRVTWSPVKEMQSLRSQAHEFESMELTPESENPLDAVAGELLEVQVEFEPSADSELVLKIRDATIRYRAQSQELQVNDIKAAAPMIDRKQRITIYCDRTGVEVFASDGLCYVPLPMNQNPDNQTVAIEVTGGKAKIRSLEVYELRSAWDRK